MTRNLIIFAISLVVGALLALVVRSALHRPYAAPAMMPDVPVVSAPMMTTADPHAGHAISPVTTPINNICAICGMEVDAELPTARFRNQVIGFGCAKCPPKFAKEPERYGPYFLRNEKAPK